MTAEIITLNREAAKRDRSSEQIVVDFSSRFSTEAHKARFHESLLNLIDTHAHLDLDFLIAELQGAMLVAQVNADQKE